MIVSKYIWDIEKIDLRTVTCFAWNYVAVINDCRYGILFVLFIYTISINILCVSQGERNLIESNQQIYDFKKGLIFENKTHSGK